MRDATPWTLLFASLVALERLTLAAFFSAIWGPALLHAGRELVAIVRPWSLLLSMLVSAVVLLVSGMGLLRHIVRRRVRLRQTLLHAAARQARQAVVSEVRMLEHAHLKALILAIQRSQTRALEAQDRVQQQLWLEEAQTMTHRLLHLVVSLHEQLDPAHDDSPLPNHLERTIQDIVRAMAVSDRTCRYRFEVSGSPVSPLPVSVRRALILILYNALLNAATHAHATQILVQLVYTPALISLQVQDNGRGFVRSRHGYAASGRGLADMQTAAQQQRGRVTIDSQPGQGTVVVATLPLPPSRPCEEVLDGRQQRTTAAPATTVDSA